MVSVLTPRIVLVVVANDDDDDAMFQVLMTNCKHGQGPSVEIVLDVELGVILFHVMYRFRDATNAVESVVEVAVPYTVSSLPF